jgi:hypothetical protein
MKCFGSLSPARLTQLSIDSIFELVSLQLAKTDFKSTVIQFHEILSGLPRELQTQLVKTAEKKLDETFKGKRRS